MALLRRMNLYLRRLLIGLLAPLLLSVPLPWAAEALERARALGADAIVTLPKGGYLIPTGWASVVLPYLQKHGVVYQVLSKEFKKLPVQALQINPDSISFESKTFQGRLRTSTVIAALGPKMLELAATRTDGAHPYFTTPEHTAAMRRSLDEHRPVDYLDHDEALLATLNAEGPALVNINVDPMAKVFPMVPQGEGPGAVIVKG